jgi:hypothetical protein
VSKLKTALHRLHTIREKSERVIDDALQVVETGAASFAAGFANEKWGTNGELELVGVPADLLAGVVLSGLAIAGAAGKYHSHALNLGSGGIAAYAYRLGASSGGGPENAQFGPFPWQQQTQGWGRSPRSQHQVHVSSGGGFEGGSEEMG